MLLEKVKKSLRISHDHLDDEIQDTINACKLDMSISGIIAINESDPLIIRAIILYCKSHLGLMNPDSIKYDQSYNALKIHLALCGDYNDVQ